MEDFELAKQGNPEAFGRLISSVKIKLYKTGMAILKNDDDTCDAIQETLISAYKNLGKLQNNEFFSTWITRILINKCYDIIRKNKKITTINKELEVSENASYYDVYSEESSLEIKKQTGFLAFAAKSTACSAPTVKPDLPESTTIALSAAFRASRLPAAKSKSPGASKRLILVSFHSIG